MYNSNGCAVEDDHNGSTKLHMDLTDAVNIMLWAGLCSDGSPGYALWHLYPPQVANILRQFFREEGFDEKAGDFIHGQRIYVNFAMQQRLYEKYGVKPYVIRQRPGEAVFIPAGWAHQVCYHHFFQEPSYIVSPGWQQVGCNQDCL
jgi:JmjC domain, hydroxylase